MTAAVTNNSLLYSILAVPLTFLIFQVLCINPTIKKKIQRILDMVAHPRELLAIVWLLRRKKCQVPTNVPVEEKTCFEFLSKVSRSFAAVIMEIHDELRTPVCVFYLVLRGLDTIEDDMNINLDLKKKELFDFTGHLDDLKWSSDAYGSGDERLLLRNFTMVTKTFQNIKPEYQDVIKEATKEMAAGMSFFLTKQVDSMEDWDRYCYYVAGLVGVGLSRLFVRAKLYEIGIEEKKLEELAISMGLFLQKTNIIRDFLEDMSESPPRVFYPRAVWGKYVNKVEHLLLASKHEAALYCLNDLVGDTLRHVPHVFEYLSLMKEPSVFRFCAVPQMMAIATLQRCFNNHGVFEYAVKVRKGEAAVIIKSCNTMSQVLDCFHGYLKLMVETCKAPTAAHIAPNVNKAMECVVECRKTL